MYGPEIRHSDLNRLGQILDSAQSDRPWQPDELGAVLRHQLESPLEFEIVLDRQSLVAGGVPDGNARDEDNSGQGLLTVGELLRTPHPPVAILEQLKAFAKAQAVDPCHVIPQEIAVLLYYAAIVAALLRCDCRITELDTESLRFGLTRLLECTWLDEMTRGLFTQGLCALSNSPPSQ